MDATYPECNYYWQQNGAPGHKAKAVQQLCQQIFDLPTSGPVLTRCGAFGQWNLGFV
ncbi:Hypothetical protein FKW44_018462 [Caligus rogercresseyi]|uniref:Uncharacterized protein n=1 Tax=Caligus rogercresseyi TaxID=217165 RepID=A0A7T8GUZ5_CALRO|nr:Hypothetical protein FKW44_018462 [Caligus rogercresseyi]